jgi:HSP20 family protein
MTSLVRYYSPLDRVFDRAFGSFFPAANGEATAGGAIALDVVETPDAYIVKAEVPGVAKDQIEVKVEDRDVTIGVEYRDEVEANGKALWRERTYGKASRAIRLPEPVDANATQAKHVDGVLQLTLPKIAKANAKQITIQ